MQILAPYTDEFLTYDANKHQYLLTLAYCKNEIGSPYTDDGEYERRIEHNSNIVYNFIYKSGNSANRQLTMKVLNCSQEGRELLKRVLMSQMKADAINGYNDLGRQNLIDFASGNVIDRNAIRENVLCVDAENDIQNSMGELDGYNVFCAIAYDKLAIEKLFEGIEC